MKKDDFSKCALIILFIMFLGLAINAGVEAVLGISIILGIIYGIRNLYEKIFVEKDLDRENMDEVVSEEKHITEIQDDKNVISESASSADVEESSNSVKPVYELPVISEYLSDTKLKKLVSKQKSKIGLPVMSDEKYELLDLSECYSLLIYGLINSGKSSIIHNIIYDIMLKDKPDDLRLLIIDTRKVEYNEYNSICHLISSIVTDPQKSFDILEKVIIEIERRYDEFDRYGCKNIEQYNKQNESVDLINRMPLFYVIIDELSDLIFYDKNQTSNLLTKILLDGRSVGVNVICSTKILDIDFLDIGLINSFSSIMSFKTLSERDARLLFGNLDSMNLSEYEFMYKCIGLYNYKKYKIVEGGIDANSLINHVKGTAQTDIIKLTDEENECDTTEEPLYNEIVEFVVTSGKASASLLQRRFRFGYNRATRCIDLLEERGIIGPANGSKPREVLVKLEKED